MAISYLLAFNPKWYFADLTGKPLGAGYIAFFDSLNKTQQKLIFEDPAGAFPWPTSTIPNVGSQGVLIDENGTQGPFYASFDSDNPDDLYYIEVYDTNGILQWTMDDFIPGSGGGGGVITEAFDIENLVNNNVFYRNVGPISPLSTFNKLAPGNHVGLAPTSSNAGPDILFLKNNTSGTDSISFPNFTLGSTELAGDITPESYLHFTCTSAGSSETTKCVQFPLNPQVQNLSNEQVIGTIWARCSGGNNQLSVYARQFFGDGAGASLDVRTLLSIFTLTSSWSKYVFTGVIPSVSGKTPGACGNDATFLQVELPFDATTSIDFIKPCLYLGDVTPDFDFQEYDSIEAITNSPRTGDIRISLNSHSFWGWVPMNDGTIGSATSNATTRANIDTFPLYNEIWTKMQANQNFAPMYTSAGALVTYGASSILDFTANNQLALTKSLGQVFGGTSNLIPSGQVYSADNATSILTATNTMNFPTGTPLIPTNSGGAAPTGIVVGQVYYSIYISATTFKIASTLANALSGTAVTFSDNGTGTNTITVYADAIGTYYGERKAVGSHTHTLGSAAGVRANTNLPSDQIFGSGVGGSFHGNIFNPDSTSMTAQNPWYLTGITDVNDNPQTYNLQPTTWMNVFIRL